MDTTTATDAPTLTLWISRYGGWTFDKTNAAMTRVTFTGPDADALAVDYLDRKRQTGLDAILTYGLAVEPDEDTEWDAFPLTIAALFPLCEHQMDARNCFGPGHFMDAAQERALSY